MNKVAKNKKFWVGELNIQFGDKQVNSFVFIDCKTNEEAELKLKEYASTFWSDLDKGLSTPSVMAFWANASGVIHSYPLVFAE